MKKLVATLAAAVALATTPALAQEVADRPSPMSGPLVEAAANVSSQSVEGSPRLLVLPSGDAYLVLHAGPRGLVEGAAWDVVYFAGYDAAVLARPDAEAALTSTARDLLEAFRPLAEVARAERLSVSAVFGKPGGRGAVRT
jgi:hypothetical protein